MSNTDDYFDITSSITGSITNVNTSYSREFLKKMHLQNTQIYGLSSVVCTFLTFLSVYINKTDWILLHTNLLFLMFFILWGAAELKEHIRLTEGGTIFNLQTLKNMQIIYSVCKFIAASTTAFVIFPNYKFDHYFCIFLQYLLFLAAMFFETYNFFLTKNEIEKKLLNNSEINNNI